MKVGIYTYGKLGRGLEIASKGAPDTELVGVFTRRNPESVKTVYDDTRVFKTDDVLYFKDEIDVMLLAGGSASDLPKMSPMLAENFNIVDSYDNHAKIAEHVKTVDTVSKKHCHTALISAGWDPGIFSLFRLLSECFLPLGKTHTFWGEGVSQGHSEAVRRLPGVSNAVQYTVPNTELLKAIKAGECVSADKNSMHKRVCYVVPQKDANLGEIENAIKTMPEYFAPYETEVNFITEKDFLNAHTGTQHGGELIRRAISGERGEHAQVMSLSLKLSSNPEFTALVLLSYARAVYRMARSFDFGAKTVFDIPPCYVLPFGCEASALEFL